MFKTNLEMGRTVAVAASKKRYRTFGQIHALGHDLVFEAQLQPDLDQPLRIDLHVSKEGRPVEPFTTLTTRLAGIEPLGFDEVLVAVHNNEFLREPLFQAGYFCDGGRRVPLVSIGLAEVWIMLPKFVRAFCEAFPELKPPPICLLPPWSYAVHPSPEKVNEVIRIERGEMGYSPVSTANNAADAQQQAHQRNALTSVSEIEAEAMLNGSLFGWDTPGADPDHLERVRASRQATP